MQLSLDLGNEVQLTSAFFARLGAVVTGVALCVPADLCICRPHCLILLLCNSLGTTAVVVEYSYPMWERLSVSTTKVIDTKMVEKPADYKDPFSIFCEGTEPCGQQQQ